MSHNRWFDSVHVSDGNGHGSNLPLDDRLLVATGASPRIPDLAGFDLPGVMALKSLSDGRRIKQFLAAHPVKKVVIIGMGYVGLEMVEALHAGQSVTDVMGSRYETQLEDPPTRP